MSFKLYFKSIILLLGIFIALTSADENINSSYHTGNILIVSTVDGKLRGIDVDSGSFIWTIENSALVSQSLSTLEFWRDGRPFRLIPSLEGQLYFLNIYDGVNGKGVLQAMPINADSLLSHSFQLSQEAVLVGGKDQEAMGINPFTGEIRYKCNKHGCNTNSRNKKTTDEPLRSCKEQKSSPTLIYRRTGHIVRAIDPDTGEEKWNFSVATDELSLPNRDSPCPEMFDDEDIAHHLKEQPVQWQFDPEKGLIEAFLISNGGPFKRVLWSRRLTSSLTRVWLVQNYGNQRVTLKKLPLFTSVSKSVPHSSKAGQDCPLFKSLYLGRYRDSLYIQLEDNPYDLAAPQPSYVSLHSSSPALTIGQSSQSALGQSRRHTSVPMMPWNQYYHHQHQQHQIYSNSLNFSYKKLIGCLILTFFAHIFFKYVYLPHQLKKYKLHNTSCDNNNSGSITTTSSVDSGLPAEPIKQVSTSSTLSMSSDKSSTVDLTGDHQYSSRYSTDFQHVKKLGRGGFGMVFEAKNRSDGLHYAVKRVRVKYSVKAEKKLLDEVLAFAHLEHPGIARYYQTWFERPPIGWQENYDKINEIVTDDEDDYDDVESGVDNLNFTDSNSSNSNDRHISPFKTNEDRQLTVGWRSQSQVIFLTKEPSQSNSASLITFQHQSSQLQHSSLNSNKSDSIPIVSSNFIYMYIAMHLYSNYSLKLLLEQLPLNKPIKSASTVATTSQIICGTDDLWLVFVQIVDAVAYLHSNRLIHRDLKPSNILFDESQHIRIVDFGLATNIATNSNLDNNNAGNPQDNAGASAEHSLTSNIGTTLYMSPEQYAGSNYDCKTDIFSLGLILIELFVPFTTVMRRVNVLSACRGQENNISDALLSENSFLVKSEEDRKQLLELVQLMLKQDPEQRISAREILQSPIVQPAVELMKLGRNPRLNVEFCGQH